MKTVTLQIPDDCEIQIIKKEEKYESEIRTYQDLIDSSRNIFGYYIDSDSKINIAECNYFSEINKNIAISEKIAKSMLAMSMISQLMPYYGGIITDEEWNNKNVVKHVIKRVNDEIRKDVHYDMFYLLAFHTEKQRDDFLKYNRQLIEDYLMI